jgi:hypothetical protein
LAHILQDLLGLEREGTYEYQIAFSHNTFIVELYPNSKLLLESLEQVRLSGGDKKLDIRKLPLNFEQFCQYHGTELSASNNANFKYRGRLRCLLIFNINRNFV